MIRMFLCLLLDPDTYLIYLYVSRSFYQQAKNEENPLVLLFVTFYEFLSLKNDVNVSLKRSWSRIR